MKKLLNNILPKFVIQILIKQKYKKYNLDVHENNIENNSIVQIKCANKEKYNFLKNILLKSFGGSIKLDK